MDATEGAGRVKPRLILLAAYGGPYEGSFIPMVRALSETAARHGWGVEIGFAPGAEEHPWYERLARESAAPVRIVPVDGRKATAAWLDQNLTEQPGPLVLHTHFTRFDLPAALIARRRPETAVIWHVHTPLYSGPRAAIRNTIKYALVGRTVDAILASGPQPAAGVLRRGAPRRRVAIVGSGVATERFPLSTPEERLAARDALGIPRDAKVLMHFSWDWALKDGDLFLATIRALLARYEEELAGLTVGGGDVAREAVRSAGLEDRMSVLEPSDDVRALYAAADLFVSSSRVEGQPFAVIEAICSGLPIVATDLPGHRDICADLPSCRVVGERSGEALADAAAELLFRPEAEADADARESRAATVARFDLGEWAERLFDRYQRCLPPRQRAG